MEIYLYMLQTFMKGKKMAPGFKELTLEGEMRHVTTVQVKIC